MHLLQIRFFWCYKTTVVQQSTVLPTLFPTVSREDRTALVQSSCWLVSQNSSAASAALFVGRCVAVGVSSLVANLVEDVVAVVGLNFVDSSSQSSWREKHYSENSKDIFRNLVS